jgi:hypothetical protein
MRYFWQHFPEQDEKWIKNCVIKGGIKNDNFVL